MKRMLSASDTITRLGGLARGPHLQRLGFSRAALARSVNRGEIIRVRDGVFGVLPLDEDLCTAVAHGGALDCASALRAKEVWVRDLSTAPHVWLGVGRHAVAHPDCTCVSHYFRGRPPLGRTDIVTALLHYRLCAGDEDFFAAYESVLNKRMLSRTARTQLRAALPNSVRWLVDIARADAESGLESLLRLRLHLLGIRLDCQVMIDGVGRVDFVIGGRLIIEVDGRENHEGESLRHKDLDRDAKASRLGYETLRFDYAQVLYDWSSVQASILAALMRLRTR